MKRILRGVLFGVLSFLIIIVPVLAAYYATLQVVESDGNSYTMLPITTDLDTDTLVDYGYITATGLDTRVVTGSGTELPHMLADDKLLFVSSISASTTYNYQFTTGSTPLSSFPVITGYEGSVNISDHANLELGNNFSIAVDGYIDTSASAVATVEGSTTSTEDSEVTSHDVNLPSGVIAGELLLMLFACQDSAATNPSATVPSGWTELDSFAHGTRGDSFVAYRIATGTENSTVTVTTDQTTESVHQTFRIENYSGTPEISSSVNAYSAAPDPASLTPSFDDVSDTLWIALFLGGHATSSSVSSYPANYSNGQFTASANTYAYAGSARRELEAASENPGAFALNASIEWVAWTVAIRSDTTLIYKQTAFALHGCGGDLIAEILGGSPKTISTPLTSGEYGVAVWGNSTHFGLDIDGVTENTTTVASVPDNSNNWTISMPYFNCYNHTVGGNHRIRYEPDSIIEGTTLPNELNPGTYDGVITWGSNPSGIAVTLGGLISSSQLMPQPTVPVDTPAPDVIQPTGVEGIESGFGTLTSNPLYPLVELASRYSGYPVPIVWIMGATLILLIAMGVCFAKAPHQLITGIVGIGLTYLFYSLTIYPWWTLLIMALVMIALIRYERKPSID